MDNFNKLFSFVLGLIVVVVFFAVLTGRINFKNKFVPLTSFNSSNKTTPTPTKSAGNSNLNKKIVSSLEVENQSLASSYKNYSSPSGLNNLKSIPSTGSETFLLPLMFSGLIGGFSLRRKK